MGFICFPASTDILPNTLITMLQLVDLILYRILAVLYRLGLNPSFEQEVSLWENEEVFLSAELSRSVLAEAAIVKSRLPAVEYMSFVKRKKHCGGGGGGAAPLECVVCLQLFEARDEVRELGNCGHAFHVRCIDRWVDLGRFSCPLCRAALLPSAGRKSGGGVCEDCCDRNVSLQ